MAASPVLQTADTQTGTGTNPLTINKPTNLASGDLMIAFVNADIVGGSWNTPTGWTAVEFGQAPSDFPCSEIFYKIATGSEAASYNFTHTNTTSQKGGSIVRITGVDQTAPIDSHISTSGTGSSNNLPIGSISPKLNNNLILIFLTADNGQTMSYACTNVSSFAEHYNNNYGASGPTHYYLAYGTSTASGSATANGHSNSAAINYFGAALSIKSPNVVAASIFGATFSFSGFTIRDLITVVVAIFGSLFTEVPPTSSGVATKTWTPTAKPTTEVWTPNSK